MWAGYTALRGYWHMTNSVPRGVLYSGQIILQYLLVGSTVAGLYHRRDFIRGIIGQFRIRDLARDLWGGFVLYLGGLVLMFAVAVVLKPVGLTHERSAVQALLPHSYFEMGIWILVSATAGVCEEFIFRGYLLQQLIRWLGNVPTAIGVSAIVFGFMHLYEGTAAVAIISVLGGYYAMMAVRRGNLRRVMVAHFLQDALTGMFLFARLHR